MQTAPEDFGMTDPITSGTQEPERGPIPEAVRARWVRAYRRNQQIAVENVIARAETEMMLPTRADWHSLLTRTV